MKAIGEEGIKQERQLHLSFTSNPHFTPKTPLMQPIAEVTSQFEGLNNLSLGEPMIASKATSTSLGYSQNALIGLSKGTTKEVLVLEHGYGIKIKRAPDY